MATTSSTWSSRAARCCERFDYDYPQMRASGYAWPIVDMRLKYVRPPRSASALKVRAEITEWENRLRIDYVIRDAAERRSADQGAHHPGRGQLRTGRCTSSVPPCCGSGWECTRMTCAPASCRAARRWRARCSGAAAVSALDAVCARLTRGAASIAWRVRADATARGIPASAAFAAGDSCWRADAAFCGAREAPFASDARRDDASALEPRNARRASHARLD